jgi:hypothetical protein
MKIIVASTTGTTVKKEVVGKPDVFDYILIPTLTATVFLSQEQYERVALAVAKRRLGDASIYPKAIILTDKENE